MRRILWVGIYIFSALLEAQERHFTLEQIYNTKELRGRMLRNVQWMPDGNSFLYLERETEGEPADLWQYEVSTGEKRVVVQGKNLRVNDELVDMKHYLISPTGDFLILTGSLIARRMKTAGNFYYFNLKSGEFKALTSTERPQKIIEIAPDGSKVAFVRDKGRILLIHGTGDDNVHFQNTISLIDALIAKNKPYELLIYPYRLHSISSGQNTVLHLFTAMTDFILQNL